MIQTTMHEINNTIKNPVGQKKSVGTTKQDNVFEQMFVHYKGQGAKGGTKAYKRKEKEEEGLEERIDNNYEGKEKKENEKSSKEEISDWNLEISKLGVLWNQMTMTEEDMGEQGVVSGDEDDLLAFSLSTLDKERNGKNLSAYDEGKEEKVEQFHKVEQEDSNHLSVQMESSLTKEEKIKRVSEKIRTKEVEKQEQNSIQRNTSIGKEEKRKSESEEKIEGKEQLQKKEKLESNTMEAKQLALQEMASSIQAGGRRSLTQAEEQNKMPVLFVKDMEQLPEQVTKQLEHQILAESKEMELQLEPANLGKIAMKISYESGKASISLICSSSNTLKVLSQQAEHMGALIEKHLGNPTEVYVEKQNDDQWSQQNGEQRDNQNSQQQREEQERRYYKKLKETKSQDFLQQLRIGLQ